MDRRGYMMNNSCVHIYIRILRCIIKSFHTMGNLIISLKIMCKCPSVQYLSTVSARLTSLTWRNLLVYVYLSRRREGQVFRCLKTTLKILSPLTRPRLQTSDRGIAACTYATHKPNELINSNICSSGTKIIERYKQC